MKTKKTEDKKEENKTKHNPEYDNLIPQEIFDIEDSDEIAEAYADMFGYN